MSRMDVGEGAAVGVLGVSYARDLQPYQSLREDLLGVGTGLLAVAAYGLVRCLSLVERTETEDETDAA